MAMAQPLASQDSEEREHRMDGEPTCDAYDSRGERTADQVVENSGARLAEHTRDEAVLGEERHASNITEKKDVNESFIEAALKKRSFYELINSQEGFLTLQGYFIKAALLLDRDNGIMQGS